MCRTFDYLFWLPIDTIGLSNVGYSMTTVQRWVTSSVMVQAFLNERQII